MADEAHMEGVEEATEPSLDSSLEVTEENEEAMNKLNDEIDNLNLVLDHLERQNGDIYLRIGQLLSSFKHNITEDE